MKQLVFIFTFLVCTSNGFAQTVIEVKKDNDPNRIYSKVDVEAGFPGGDSAWRIFLRKNLNPSVLVDNGAKPGTYKVIVRFIVSKDGSISDIYCVDDPGYGSCEEAIRVIKKTRNWIPALVNGNKVNAYRSQPFTYVVEKPF